MTSNKDENPKMNPKDPLAIPTPKVPLIIPIVNWVGSSIGGWFLGEGLNFLKGLIFPGSSSLTMDKYLQKLKSC
ncbi:TPA: hypothetical protein QCY66_005518 [Bacillus cereus]|nr:hypothetical protein [Bacillus cereus]